MHGPDSPSPEERNDLFSKTLDLGLGVGGGPNPGALHARIPETSQSLGTLLGAPHQRQTQQIVGIAIECRAEDVTRDAFGFNWIRRDVEEDRGQGVVE